MKESIRVGIVQEGPAYFNLKASIEKLTHLLDQATGEGAELVVFGESWFTGYPAWLDSYPGMALWDHEPTKMAYALMYENAIQIPGPETRLITQKAAQYKIYIVIGANERIETGPGNGTLYNTLLFFSPEGKMITHHRKLMPTFTERMAYGQGDGCGLVSHSTPWGRMGGLICWEHWMPLARQAMHNQGEQIHIAVWPTVHEKHQLASQHYAFEGRCYVIAAGQILKSNQLPKELGINGKKDEILMQGGSCIVGPDGSFLLPPQMGTEGVIIYEIGDLQKTIRERMTLDVSGHYNRPDVFSFDVNKKRL
jgi:predicted amidohydrolase